MRHLTVKAGAPVAPVAQVVVPVAKSAAVVTAPVMVEAAPAVASGGLLWTPRARTIIEDAGLDPATVTGLMATGPGGRVSGDDVTKFLDERTKAATTPITASATAAAPVAGGDTETVCIAGVGFAVPKGIRPTSEILKEFPGRTEAEMLKLTGIRERRFAGPGETATGLAAIAVQHALDQAGMKVTEIDGIVLATIIPDQPVPSMASALAKHLGIPKALAFDLNAACSGWLYALEVGRAFIRGGTAKNVSW